MLNVMDAYYDNMKTEMGLKERPETNEEDIQLDEVLNKLRPNTTARNFKDFLGRKDNINRNQYWKKVSRKLDGQDQTQQMFNNSVHIGGAPYADRQNGLID
jgi:hypothetical protein